MNKVTNPTTSKVVIVTGAAGGIGQALCERLLKSGFRVCATDSNYEGLKLLSERVAEPTHLFAHTPTSETPLQKSDQESFFTSFLDVTQKQSILDTEKQILSRWGQIDVLVNNAGIFRSCKFEETSEESFTELLNINLTGTFRTTQVFARSMMSQKQGKIITISSIAGVRGASGAAHYAASKGALNAWSLSLAVELAPYQIQVNLVQPGFIDTPLMSKEERAVLKKVAQWRTPVKRLGTSSEVAETIHFLVNSESPYLTGCQIVIDGGFSLG